MTTDTTISGVEEPPLPSGFIFANSEEDMAKVAAVLAEANAEGAGAASDVPLLGEPGPDEIILPGGIVRDGALARHAEIRELRGEDEEFIARAMSSTNGGRFISALLERGVVAIGGKPVDKELLQQLLIGDRDMLALGVRKMTYGRTINVQMLCVRCAVESEVQVDLEDDVPVKHLSWSADITEHTITVPSGKHIVMRLGNGGDQAAIFDSQASRPNVTNAEMNSMLLARTIVEYDHNLVNPKGALELVRKEISGGDRQVLIKWLVDNQPGPMYNDVKHTCDVCGEEQSLGLSVSELFPSF